MGKDGSHLKILYSSDLFPAEISECIGFKLGDYMKISEPKSFDIAFTVEENHWKGNVTYYLNIRNNVVFRD